MLYAIYDLRKNETEPDLDELNSIKLKFITHFYMFLVKKYYLEIEHSLSMIHFLSKDYEKVLILIFIIGKFYHLIKLK